MKQMMTKMVALSLASFALLWAGATEAASKKRHIEVSAQAELEVDPDVVDLRFTIRAEKKTPKQAVQAITAREKVVLAALKKAGMPANDVQISFLSLRPRFVYKRSKLRGRRRLLRGYDASKTYVACVRDLDKMTHFVTALAAAGGDSFSTAFRSTKIPTHKRKLRAMAVQAGKAKAAELAKHAGVALGAVIFIKETNRRGGYSPSNSFAYSRRRGARGARPGAVKLRLSVRIAFLIK